eukprot:scaffold22482_cov69-Phaeocystis_antarctica.AAC.6
MLVPACIRKANRQIVPGCQGLQAIFPTELRPYVFRVAYDLGEATIFADEEIWWRLDCHLEPATCGAGCTCYRRLPFDIIDKVIELFVKGHNRLIRLSYHDERSATDRLVHILKQIEDFLVKPLKVVPVTLTLPEFLQILAVTEGFQERQHLSFQKLRQLLNTARDL